MFISIPNSKFCYKNHLKKPVQKGHNPVLQFFVTKSQIMQSSSVQGHKVKIIYMKSCESRKQTPLQKPLIA